MVWVMLLLNVDGWSYVTTDGLVYVTILLNVDGQCFFQLVTVDGSM